MEKSHGCVYKQTMEVKMSKQIIYGEWRILLWLSLFATGPTPVGNLVVGLVCGTMGPSVYVWIYISVTAGRIVLILGIMMGYDLELMPVVSKCGYTLLSQMHIQKCLFPKEVPLL